MKIEDLKFDDHIIIQNWRYPHNIDLPKKFEGKFIGKIGTYVHQIILGPKNPKADLLWGNLRTHEEIKRRVSKVDLYQYSFYIAYADEITDEI